MTLRARLLSTAAWPPLPRALWPADPSWWWYTPTSTPVREPIRYQQVYRKPMQFLPPVPATVLEPITYQVRGLQAGTDYVLELVRENSNA